MEQQSAVEFLISQISKDTLGKSFIATWKQEFEQAKQMEKERREQDFIDGYKKRAELSNLMFDKASELFARSLFNEINKTK